ncbi:MAG: DUF192 domain-containing protein [Methyloceanibacter sp.]|uniref:DUF192 domain-containing protein n=1 Tax=Methyloceanibacter sp. TaxID=1965321 RepID=UPI003EE04D50
MTVALALPLGHAAAAGTDTLVLKTESGEHSYTVEIADTDRERATGLMFRRSLPEKSGMIFLYDPPQRVGMWMRNTYIPLDMVFITAEGTVRRVEADTEPFSTDLIRSGGEVAAVLELNAGQAAKIGVKPGDRVVFPGLGTETAP